MNKPELLAPAGDMECLKTAVRFGADAVYVGGPFMQLRAQAAGFDNDTLAEASEYVHRFGKKLYVTANSFAKNDEINKIEKYAEFLYSIGANAAIVSDLGAIAAMRAAEPRLEIHVSTQANCQNYKCAEVYRSMGASRVVMARENSLREIAELHRLVPELEIEAFVHGAMCMSYSGRCMLSTFTTGRSANRGECAQPCRWQYHIVEQKRPNEFFPVEQSENGLAVLSSQDLNCMPFVDKLIEAGVSSLKIEGRMKSPYYVATVVNAYRMRIDGSAPIELLENEVCCVSHRPYCSGFYFGKIKPYLPDDGAYIRECTYAAIVFEKSENGRVKIEQRNLFCVGDELEVVRPGTVGLKFTVEEIENTDGESVSRANHAKELLFVNCPLELEPGDMLRIRH
ncbi:MAG: U32 family peptidase [Oscillospiraceae bacterium]